MLSAFWNVANYHARIMLVGAALLLAGSPAHGQRQMERLGRGVVAMPASATQVYVGWRMLGTDPGDIGFNLYRIAGGVTNRLNGAQPLTNTTDYLDTPPSLGTANAYFVRPVLAGVEQPASASFTLPPNPRLQPYLEVPIQPPSGGVTPDGVTYTYSANDCSVGDLDGDGEYEIVLKWDPSNSKDNSQSGYTGDVFLDAYKLDGTRLWRIDLGKNIRAGAHYTQFIVYDLDGDGKAEVACKTAPGTIDGQGNYVLLSGDDPNADYRNASGYILSGPEYLSVFEGQTGAALATTSYNPPRGNVSSWGDSYGNRVDRFLACVAYLDGVRPSLVMCRGYYTRAVLAAWNWREGRLTNIWTFDSNDPGYDGYAGQGNHNLTVADVDHDGKDEIVYGACCIGHDGTGLYTTGLGHGDAMHVSDMDPDRPGLEVWDVHETPSSASGGELRDARTGQVLFTYAATTDTGRGMASHIDASHRGYQMWSSATDGVYDTDGTRISTSKPSVNFAVWWDADLERELLDGTKLDKWTGNGTTRLLNIYNYGNAVSINGTKANPCLSADILGDWREEMIFPSADSTRLLIFTTTIPATNRFYTFMHDPQYRLSIAWQNVTYNQPPHTSFYIGEGMHPPPVPPVSDAKLVWLGGLATNAWDAANTRNWLTNGLWASNFTTTVFNPGDTVRFDLTGSNSLPVRLAGTLSPAKVTVNSPGDYVMNGPGSLAGTMGLVKAGAGTLTLDTTNTYSGETAVRDGVLLVNGSLLQSPVTVWGNGWGGGVVGGSGCLGRSLTLQAGGNLMPGKGTNLPGTLVISNSLTEAGGTVNHFFLSDDPSGTLKSNAMVKVFGNVTIAGSNVIFIHPLSGALGPGTYTLFAYSGVLNGGLSNLNLAGLSGAWASLTNPPGRLALNVLSNSSSSLRWLGGAGNYWDVAMTSNWLNGAALARFHPDDSVRFDNAGSTNPLVNLVGSLTPSAVVVDASADYTFGGSGTIGGSCSLAKSNSGTLTILITNGYTGTTFISGGTLVAASLAGPGLPSSIGASGGDPTNVVFDGGTLRYTGGSGSVSRGVTLNARGGTLAVESAIATLTLGGSGLVGSGTLTKTGLGTLALTADSSFTGGLALNAGTVSLGSLGSGGSGAFRLNGGTFYLAAPGSPAVYANALSVAAPSTIASPGTGNNNQALAGSWSGSATLYVNTGSGGTLSVKGDMTDFNGSLVLLGGGYFRFYGSSSGSSAASFDLGTSTAIMHTRDGGTISLGSLSGGTGTVLRGASSSANPSTFVVGANNGDAIFSGTIADGTKGSTATTAITKVGSGAWTLSGTHTYTGPTTVSNGTLLVNGVLGINQVAVYGKLGGNGVLAGPVTVQPAGTLVPGPGLCLLTISNSLALMPGSATVVELSKSPATNDAIRVTGSLTLGGTLMLTNIGSIPLQAGDSFKLFSAPPAGGAFDTIVPATAGPGLRWDTTALAASGMLRIVAAPVPRFVGLVFSTNSVVIRGVGGETNGSYFVLTSTNVAFSLSQWTPSATNRYDANGNFIFTNTVVPNAPQNFYILQLP